MNDPHKYFDGQDNWTWDGSEWKKDPPPPTGQPVEAPALADPSADSRRGKKILVLAGLGIVAAVVLALVVANVTSKPKAYSSSSSGALRKVVYFVDGSASSADITYATASGISQQSGVSVPLVRSATKEPGIVFMMPAGTFVSISAQNKGETGTLNCRIEVDGIPVSSNSAMGAYTIASCSGTAI